MSAAEGIDGSQKPSEAAARLGVTQATFTNWRSRGVSQAGILQASARLGVSAHWLATGEGDMRQTGTNTQGETTGQQLSGVTFVNNLTSAGGVGRPRLVHVVGTARLGENGFYEEISCMTGAGDGMVEAYSEDPAAYALKVRGDSMYPAIRDGWFVIVEPATMATPGDFVLLKLATGERMVKELIMQRHDGITVVSVNGDTRKSYALDELDPHFGMQAVSAIVSPRKWLPQ